MDATTARHVSLFVVGLALYALTGCHAHQEPPLAALSRHHSAARAAAPSVPGPIALSPTNLQLPEPAQGASVREVQFYAAATRAVRHVYEDDIDDPSQALALTQRLQRDPNLGDAKRLWQPILQATLRRADSLRSFGPMLRALRQAIANTWRDEASHTYRDVDMASCRIAKAQMPGSNTIEGAHSWRDTVVTIEPLGAYPIDTLLRFCEDPRSLFGQE